LCWGCETCEGDRDAGDGGGYVISRVLILNTKSRVLARRSVSFTSKHFSKSIYRSSV
jgi:hypothetical protein